MTDAERNLVVECLEYRRAGISSALLPQKHAMLCQLTERFKAAKVSDAKPKANPPAKPKRKPPAKPLRAPTTSDGTPTVKEAIEQVGRIVGMCEEVAEYDNSDTWDFASGVEENATAISETIEKRNHVTPAQAEALDNMESGISKWIR